MATRRARSVGKYVLLTAVATVTVLIPLWVMLVNSAKPFGEADSFSLSLPHVWKIGENYSTVVRDGDALQGFRNSLIVTVPSVLIVTLVGSLAGWVFARGRGRVMSLMYYLAIAGILLPPSIVTTVLVLKRTHVFGSFAGVILFYSGVFLSFAIFFICGFVKNIPIELEEAARLEGCRPIGVFVRVIFPLLRPVLLSTVVVVALFIWTDFFYPFFLINDPSHNTLPLGLYSFVSQHVHQERWNLVFADMVVVTTPLIVLYFFAQKHIVAGLTGGSVNR
jgi:raffinose/stachyose/melibiose transport system permease protein